jgi:hypothetical protein
MFLGDLSSGFFWAFAKLTQVMNLIKLIYTEIGNIVLGESESVFNVMTPI